MRSWRQLGIVAIFFLQRLSVFGDEAITSFMSPIASYQNQQDLNSEILTNGGIGSPFVSYQYLENLNIEILSNGNLISPMVSYYYFNFGELELKINQPTIQPTQPVFSNPFAKEPGKDCLIVITHGWNPSWNESDTSWVDTMSNAITANLISLGMTNWQVNGYKWVPYATMAAPVNVGFDGVEDILLNHARQEGNHLGFSLARQGWAQIHFIGHSAGSELIQQACEVVKDYSTAFSSAEAPPTVQCTFLDPFLGSDFAGLKNYGARADWADCYYSRDLLTGTFTQGCLSNAFNVDVTQLDISERKYTVTKFYSSAAGDWQPCYVTESVHGWPMDFYLNTITGNNVTTDYSGLGFPMSLEDGGFWLAKNSFQTGNIPAVQLGIPDPVCRPEIQLTPEHHADVVADLIGWPSRQSATGTAIMGSGFLTLFTGSPAWVAVVVDSTNILNTVSFDAQFTSGQGAQGLLSVYWDADTIGYVDERMVPAGLEHYSFTFPNANANTAHVLGFRLDPFTNIQSIVVMTNIGLNVIGPTETFTLSVTTNKVGDLPVFQLNGQAGYEYGVQMSTNLAGTNWTYVASLVNTNGVVNFYGPESITSTIQFYRAVLVP